MGKLYNIRDMQGLLGVSLSWGSVGLDGKWDLKSHHRLWRPWTQIQADHNNHSCRVPARQPPQCSTYIYSMPCQLIAAIVWQASHIAASVVQSQWAVSLSWSPLSLLSWLWLMMSSVLLWSLSLYLVQCSCHDGDNCRVLYYTKRTSVNMQFAKLEQHTYGLWPRHENVQ